ncbi:unnamed protein product [Gemmataceae bacterium]|nr:unnamed protein product [Gemmataceae bacterium]VTT99773.1 unnamed protein product [Gemmataceae bacterium]
MVLSARCPGCGRSFAFDAATAASAAVVGDAGRGQPVVRRCYLCVCPGCRNVVRVPGSAAGAERSGVERPA